MNQGKLVFAQIMEHLPLTTFRRCVARYDGEHKVQRFSCLKRPTPPQRGQGCVLTRTVERKKYGRMKATNIYAWRSRN
jgi:hypothetical protein